jgi:hypothetical protein
MTPSITIFEAGDVRQVRMLHAPIIRRLVDYQTVGEQLHLFVDNLWKYFQKEDAAATIEIRNYHPDWLGAEALDILVAPLQLEDLRLCIAKEYGFEDWEEVQKASQRSFDPDFEVALEHIQKGDTSRLTLLLEDRPDLVHMHSPYGHQACLLHYVAANGVEIWRQQVPENAVAIAEVLLRAGANPEEPHRIYGGQSTLVELVQTCAHLQAAGVRAALADYLINQ